MTLSDYIDRYATLAWAVHALSNIELCIGDDGKAKGCDQMSHCSYARLPEIENVPYVQLYTGIREIAKRLDFVLHEDTDDDSDTVRLWFVFRGVEFLQVEDKK